VQPAVHHALSSEPPQAKPRGLRRRVLAGSAVVLVICLVAVTFAVTVGTTTSVTIHPMCSSGPGADPRTVGFDVGRASAAGTTLGQGRIETTHRLFRATRYTYIGDDGTRATLLPPVQSGFGFSCP